MNIPRIIIVCSLFLILLSTVPIIGFAEEEDSEEDEEEFEIETELPEVPNQECVPEDVSSSDDTDTTIGVVNGEIYDQEINAQNVYEEDPERYFHIVSARVEVIRCMTFSEPVEVETIQEEEFDFIAEDLSEIRADLEYQRMFYRTLLLHDDRMTDYETTIEGNFISQGIIYLPDESSFGIKEGDSGFVPRDQTISYLLVLELLEQNYDEQVNNDFETFEEKQVMKNLQHGDAHYTSIAHTVACMEDEQYGEDGCINIDGVDYIEYLYPNIELPTLYGRFAGASFVAEQHSQNGWEEVNDLYENPPTSTADYHMNELNSTDTVDIEIQQSNPTGDWQLIQHPEFGAENTIGPSGLGSTVWFYLPDDVKLAEDPITPYQFNNIFIEGWQGDTLEVYNSVQDDENGFVHAIEFETAEDVDLFIDQYHSIMSTLDGEQIGENTYDIQRTEVDNPVTDDPALNAFYGTYHLDQQDDRVVIVYTEDIDSLESLYGGVEIEQLEENDGTNNETDNGEVAETNGTSIIPRIFQVIIVGSTLTIIGYYLYIMTNEEE